MDILNIVDALVREVTEDYLQVAVSNPATLRSMLAPMLGATRDIDLAANMSHVFGLANDTLVAIRALGSDIKCIGLTTLTELQVLDRVTLQVSVSYSAARGQHILILRSVRLINGDKITDGVQRDLSN